MPAIERQSSSVKVMGVTSRDYCTSPGARTPCPHPCPCPVAPRRAPSRPVALDRRARRGLRSDTRGTWRREGGVSPYELALHTWTLDTTPLADALRIAKRTGWNAVELRRIDFDRARDAGHPAERVLDLVRASGLGVAAVGAELGWMFAEGAERERLFAVFAESCRWAAALGCATVMSPVDRGSGPRDLAGARTWEGGYD